MLGEATESSNEISTLILTKPDFPKMGKAPAFQSRGRFRENYNVLEYLNFWC